MAGGCGAPHEGTRFTGDGEVRENLFGNSAPRHTNWFDGAGPVCTLSADMIRLGRIVLLARLPGLAGRTHGRKNPEGSFVESANLAAPPEAESARRAIGFYR